MLGLVAIALGLGTLLPTSFGQASVPPRSNLGAYCTTASNRPLAACSLFNNLCKDESKPYCSTLAILNALCSLDNPPSAQDALCKPYAAYCTANDKVCKAAPAWPMFAKTVVYQFQIYKMCSVHNMVSVEWIRRRPHSWLLWSPSPQRQWY
jgi:hypothetical protein